MLVEFKETEYCKIEAHYKAEPSFVKSKKEEIISKFRNRKVSGYRNGKAPNYAVELAFKKEIEDVLKNELAKKAFDDVLFETKIKHVGYPQYSSLILSGDKFECDLYLLKRPDFELKQYTGFDVPEPHVEKTIDEFSELMLQELRVRHGDIVPFEDNDFIQPGDQVTMDFKLVVDGKLLDGGAGEGVLYTIGEQGFPAFDENLLGMKAGESRDFEVALPDYIAGSSGKVAAASVTCHMGSRKVACPLDDALAAKVGFATFDELVAKVTHTAAVKIQQTKDAQVMDQISKRLVSDNEMTVPTFLISAEISASLKQQNVSLESLTDEDRDNQKIIAANNIKLALILDAIREKEPEAELSEAEMFTMLKERLLESGVDSNSFLADAQKDGKLMLIFASLKNEHTLKWIASKTNIIQ